MIARVIPSASVGFGGPTSERTTKMTRRPRTRAIGVPSTISRMRAHLGILRSSFIVLGVLPRRAGLAADHVPEVVAVLVALHGLLDLGAARARHHGNESSA